MSAYRYPIIWLLCFFLWALPARATEPDHFAFRDDAGRMVRLPALPAPIVSHVPMVSEILREIGAAQSALDAGVLVFYSPSAPMGDEAAVRSGRHIAAEPKTIAEDLHWIEHLGALTGRRERAKRLAANIQDDLAAVAIKTASLPKAARLRMLGMGFDGKRMVPLTGPRHTDLIRRAGGLPPSAEPLSVDGGVHAEALMAFDPELIFAPREQRREILASFQEPGWQHITAIRNRQVYFFPARLLDHSISHAGYLVNALASRAYPQLYTDPTHQVRPNRIFRTRRVPMDLAMVTGARIGHHYRYDFMAKTLVVDFTSPQKILSTLEGMRSGIFTVGNHYAAPPCWWLDAHSGLGSLRNQVLPAIDRPAASTSLLFTGADMDHLAVETARFREMGVTALVTAGVRGNAMRLSQDRGNYYEPGTINIILMTSMRLSERAMSRALVTATEAKTAALWDLDIRSSYTPRRHAATGTGTDNLIVVQNSGAETAVDNSGGHTKMGELIATAVYRGVLKAIAGQNGLTIDRSVMERLAERRVEIDRLVAATDLPEAVSAARFLAAIHRELQRPAVANLLTAAMSLDDAAGRGLTRITTGFEDWCRQVAAAVAGRPVTPLNPMIEIDPETPALNLALNAVWNGVLQASTALAAEKTEPVSLEK